MKRILFLITIVLLVASCASKRYAKKAAKFEEAGLYEDAAEYYYQSVKKKDSNVEAKLGLRKNGQLTLEKKLADFTEAYKQANYKDAVYKYLEAEKYHNKVKSVNVELSFPEHHKAYYEEAKGDYLRKKYTDGSEKLDREEFTEALKVFDEILKIDSEYKDVKDKFRTAKYEPMYREANEMMDLELYRSAYYKFTIINKGAGNYKQVVALKEEALEKATIRILVYNIASVRYRSDAAAISSSLKGTIGDLDNPFIKVVDISAYGNDIIDQRTKMIDMTAANLAGINLVLTGQLKRMSAVEGRLNKKTKRGYLKQVEKYKTKEGEEKEKVSYHKTEYFEYDKQNTASLELTYKVVSTDNNELVISENFSRSRNDKVHYATYDGNTKILVPGYWESKGKEGPKDIVKDNSSDRKKLQNLLKADKKITSSSKLLDQLKAEAIKEITSKVNKYNPETR